jgi:hypothetical protein
MQNQKQEKKHKTVMEMTLCHSCATDFRNSNYIVVQKGFQKEKETCDFCNVRQGLTYGVFNKD